MSVRCVVSRGEAVLALLCARSTEQCPPHPPPPLLQPPGRGRFGHCEHEMSHSILHLELVPPDEWKTVSPCVQKSVISAGSYRLRKRPAVCRQTGPVLAGCSLLSVCWSSSYLSQCDTASAPAKLAQSTRFSVSPNSIRFPLNAANSTLN